MKQEMSRNALICLSTYLPTAALTNPQGVLMKTCRTLRHSVTHLLLIFCILGLSACAAPGGTATPVTVATNQANVVSYWNDIANKTVLATSKVTTTVEEQRPALFPNRSEVYQAAYDQRLATIPAGQAKTQGLALGSEVAAGVVRLRANDGRNVALAPYVSGTAAGQFRSANPTPIFRHFPAIKPFALDSLAQFRPAPPPALNSAAYAVAFNETRSLGGADSTLRTAEQLEAARFHTEPPPPAVTRNLGRFASCTTDVVDAARLMAMVYVTFADTLAACFEAKYHYNTWRPVSAIHMADVDGNDATPIDAAWKPVLPTPNHPEYPAAHSCTSGSLGETLRSYYGTPNVTFTWDSSVTGTTRTYAGIEAFNADAGIARLYGGMHFRFATVAGEALGKQVAQWVTARHFGRQQ